MATRLLANRLYTKRWSFIKPNTSGLWRGSVDHLPEDHWIRRRFRYEVVLHYFRDDLSNCQAIVHEYQHF